MSGRIVDIAVVERDPYTIYVASATGGVWKSTDNGVNWKPVFEHGGTHSVGDIAVSQVDTSIVWVGTGERASRQSNSWGDGVYRSADGGTTWENMGLRETKAIGRIALSPVDPDIVFVAAMGHLWGPNEERGLYRSTDRGRTWQKVLYVDENTGVVDVAIDPSDPNVVYAASYQRRRRAYGFDGGGPGSGLWKSTDGGATWARLTGHGLPAGEYGRIGISIYRSDPRIVYVSIEQGYRYNASTAYTERRAGLYRSEDRGATWTHMSDWNPRPMYASQPLVDPNDDQRIYMMNSYSYSDDGGKTFTTPDQSLHGDDRIVWVDPSDSRHVIKGDDGGVGISYDRGLTWLFVTSLPISQWYHVAVDNAVPFNIYGGLQDNGSWVGPSATYRSEGILNEDWTRTGGGDGFLSLADTVDGRTFYSESQYLGLLRLDRVTWERQDIRPGDPHGHISDRRNWDAWGPGIPEPDLGNAMAPANWDAPFLISPHDHNTLYAGTNQLWKSTDQGRTWTSLGDLTTEVDRRELRIMGRRANDTTPSLDDGVPYYPTLTAIEESPLRRGVLYVGTDDGNLRISQDDGATWTEVSGRLPGLPDTAWISDIEASHHDAGTVYVVANNYRSDDYGNYLYRSTDGGATWTSIVADLPAERVLRAVREDPRNPAVLYLAAELGLFYTLDGGQHWAQLRANMPTVAFNDVVVHPRDNDLVLASHGRGVWILDNVNALQELTPAVMSEDAHLFTIEPAFEVRRHSEKAHTGDMLFTGKNPPDGAIIDYWLGTERDSGDVAIAITDASGATVAAVPATGAAGVNRVVWDLRHARLPARPGARSGRGPEGPLVLPGTYTVRLTVGGRSFEQHVEVREDPRLTIQVADRRAWNDALERIADLYRGARDEVARLLPLSRRLPPLPGEQQARDEEEEGARAAVPPVGPPLAGSAAQAVRAVADPLEELFDRIGRLYSEVSDWTGAPTADQRTQLDYYTRKLTELRPQVTAVLDRNGG